LTGIAWDHINVFPTFENYVEQFKIFIDLIQDNGCLIHFKNDEHITELVQNKRDKIDYIPYGAHPYKIQNNKCILQTVNGDVELEIFGEHNLQNLMGAYHVCKQLGISDENFYGSIKTFSGASKRLQKLAENENCTVFQDFAHSPSKLKATTEAVKKQFSNRKLIACMELHTFSSLKKEFLPQYQNTMSMADQALVYFNPKTIEHKKLEPITKEQVKDAFGGNNICIYTDSDQLIADLRKLKLQNSNVLLMSSGNFSGVNLAQLAEELCTNN
jgi:UDP-N-acetylmuramate: L-alanyl-gamma-D-glutamyl-meso-diaminopimelate ligase